MADILERPQLKSLKKYIPGKSIEEVQRELGLAETIKMASNENPLGPSPKAVEAMHAELDNVNLYPDSTCRDLTVELAARLGIGEDNLLFGNGADGILTIIAQAFVCPTDEAIFGSPSFQHLPTGG
jgi:histidinol-phosphate aminotransferase